VTCVVVVKRRPKFVACTTRGNGGASSWVGWADSASAALPSYEQ
jgi:hypothetical protein